MPVFPLLDGTEIVVITANLSNAEIFQAAGVDVTTTAAIAALGGGGGGGGSATLTVQRVTSGTSTVVAAGNIIVVFNSATTSAKTCSIPAAGTSLAGQQIVIKDAQYTAGTYNITTTPVSGTIEGQASLVSNVNGQSWTLVADGANNWCIT